LRARVADFAAVQRSSHVAREHLIRSRIRTVLGHPGKSLRPGRQPSGSVGIHNHPAPLLATALAGSVNSDCRDPLLAKSAQGVPYRPWPGLTASAGLLKSTEVRARWCQPWVSPAWRPVRFSFCRDHRSVVIYTRTHYLPIPLPPAELLLAGARWTATLSVVVRPKCSQSGQAVYPARSGAVRHPRWEDPGKTYAGRPAKASAPHSVLSAPYLSASCGCAQRRLLRGSPMPLHPG
jgi:hypothetical protein